MITLFQTLNLKQLQELIQTTTMIIIDFKEGLGSFMNLFLTGTLSV